MQHAVDTVIEWQRHTARRRFLVDASNQLLVFVRTCSALIFSGEAAASADNNRATSTASSVRMLMWHWQATAPMLCARSDGVIRIRDAQGPAKALEATAADIAAQITQQRTVRYDLEVARLRQICVLLDLMRSTVKTSQGERVSILANTSAATRSTLAVFLVQLLESAVRRTDSAVVELIRRLLQSGLVEPDSDLILMETQDEARVIAAQLVGCLQRTADTLSVGSTQSKSVGGLGVPVRSLVEELVADIVIARQLSIVTLTQKMLSDESSDSTEVQVRSII
jgi:hypothetical protein